MASRRTVPRERAKSKGGRPKKEIRLTPEQIVAELAGIFCTSDEIAAILGISRSTLYERFPDALKNGRQVGKQSLRRAQWDAARAGNPAVLIWLGKQYLGQTDKLPDFSKLTDEELLRFVAGSAASGEGVVAEEAGEAGTAEPREIN
jgi:hypothetical protein